MRTTFLLAAVTLASCSGVEAEDVVLPNRETLVSRYGTVAPGTFHVRQPSIRLDVEGDDFSLSGVSKTLYLSRRELNFFSLGIGSEVVIAVLTRLEVPGFDRSAVRAQAQTSMHASVT